MSFESTWKKTTNSLDANCPDVGYMTEASCEATLNSKFIFPLFDSRTVDLGFMSARN